MNLESKFNYVKNKIVAGYLRPHDCEELETSRLWVGRIICWFEQKTSLDLSSPSGGASLDLECICIGLCRG